MNLMMTKATNRAALITRHSVSYCGRFLDTLQIRPFYVFSFDWRFMIFLSFGLSSRHAFFRRRAFKLSMDKFFIHIKPLLWLRLLFGLVKKYGNFNPAKIEKNLLLWPPNKKPDHRLAERDNQRDNKFVHQEVEQTSSINLLMISTLWWF